MRSISLIALWLGLTLGGAAQAQNVRMACHVKEVCAGIEPGGGRIMDCLRAHKDELSEKCYAAIGQRLLNRPVKAQPASGAAPAGAPPTTQDDMDEQPAPGTPAAAPPGQEQPPK
jgi:hypothetical protein